MSAAAFIAGDWGTSNLRLALCDVDGRALDTRAGPGAAAARGRFADVFAEVTADWNSAHGELPAVLCGMVGSAFGWSEAPYLPCPEELDAIGLQTVSPAPGVSIVPGMRCANPLGAPDVMRGEETQLLGASRLDPSLREGRKLVCLPGTHTKWVALLDGTVIDFLTVPTGELFALLVDHSVLVRDPDTPLTHSARDFALGLDEAARHPGVPLPHRLFQSRSLRLDKQLSAQGAASFTSGLLIGTDVAGALPLFPGHEPAGAVHVVGAQQLVEAYCEALTRHGRKGICIDGGAAALVGLTHVHRVQSRMAA